jgi:hypothetical protein
MLFQVHVALPHVIIKIPIKRHLKHRDEHKLAQGPHLLSYLHSIQHSNVDGGNYCEKDTCANAGFVELASFAEVVPVEFKERVLFIEDQSASDLVCLLVNTFLFK